MDFETMSRKELQALAKQHGIKANLSTNAIIEALQQIFPKSEEPVADEIVIEQPVAKESSPVKEVEVQRDSVPLPRKSILFQPEINLEEHVKSLPEVQQITSGPFNTTKISNSTNFEAGQYVQFTLDGEVVTGVIKKVNKVTCRVSLDDGEEKLIKSNELTIIEKVEEEVVSEAPVEVAMEEEEVPVPVEPVITATSSEETEATSSFTIPLVTESEEELREVMKEVEVEVERTDEELLQQVDRVLDESMIDYDHMDVEDMDEEAAETPAKEEEDEEDDGDYEQNEEESFFLPNMDSLIGGDTPQRHSMTASAIKGRKSMIIKSPLDRFSYSAKKLSLSARKSFPNVAQTTTTTAATTTTGATTLKKTFSTTPLKAKPAIVPRTNAAQLKRLEALKQKKMEDSQPVKDTATTTGASIAAKKKTPLPTAPAGIIKTASTAANNTETQKGSVSVKFDMGAEDKTQNKANAKLLARKATPNFKALHKKQFENSKSIASLVDRDHSIAKKMDAAFSAAQNGQFSSINHPKSTSKPNPLTTTRTTPASVKPVKPIAMKKPANLETKVISFVQEKENSQPTTSNASSSSAPSFLTASQFQANKMRVNAKEASVVKITSNKQEVRRQSFNKTVEANRKNMISQKRAEKTTSFVV